MKKLAFFCIGILILFTAGCSGGSKKATYPANSPEAAAQAYYQALQDGKPDTAYQYRKFDPPKTKDQFVSERQSAGMTFKSFSVGKAQITGTTASVPVTFQTGNSAMPEFTMNIQLVKEDKWLVWNLGVGGQAGEAHGGSGGQAPAMPPASGGNPSAIPPASGGNPSAIPPASGANPHGPGGSIPLDQK